MVPRYFISSGRPPLYVAAIIRVDAHRGYCLLQDIDKGELKRSFSNNAELINILQKIIDERIPLSVGAHCPGPADEAILWVNAGRLSGVPIMISWQSKDRWSIREYAPDGTQWESAKSCEEILYSGTK